MMKPSGYKENLEKAKELFECLKDSYPDAPNLVQTELDKKIRKCDESIRVLERNKLNAEFVEFEFNENKLVVGGKNIELTYKGERLNIYESRVGKLLMYILRNQEIESLHYYHYPLLFSTSVRNPNKLKKNFTSVVTKLNKSLAESGVNICKIEYQKDQGRWLINRHSKHYNSSVDQARELYKQAELMFSQQNYLESYNLLITARKYDSNSIDINLLLLNVLSSHVHEIRENRNEVNFIVKDLKHFVLDSLKKHHTFLDIIIETMNKQSVKQDRAHNLYNIISPNLNDLEKLEEAKLRLNVRRGDVDPLILDFNKLIDKLCTNRGNRDKFIKELSRHIVVTKALREIINRERLPAFLLSAYDQYGLDSVIFYYQASLEIVLSENRDINWEKFRNMDLAAREYLLKVILQSKDFYVDAKPRQEESNEFPVGNDDEVGYKTDIVDFDRWKHSE